MNLICPAHSLLGSPLSPVSGSHAQQKGWGEGGGVIRIAELEAARLVWTSGLPAQLAGSRPHPQQLAGAGAREGPGQGCLAQPRPLGRLPPCCPAGLQRIPPHRKLPGMQPLPPC